jgi:hypothetical protein
MSRTNDFIVLPTLAIPIFPLSAFFHRVAMAIGKGALFFIQKLQPIQ